MTKLLLMALAAVSTATAMWITERLLVYALSANMIDHASRRSSHSAPTPRGGGGSIVIVGALGIVASAMWLRFPADQAIGLIGGGLLVALVGWIDDHGHVSAAVRLIAHIWAASWAVWWIGPFDLHLLPVSTGLTAILEPTLSVIGVVWLINLYNFMDGIDGIAGSEAICVALGGSLLLWVMGYGAREAAPFVLLAAATLGFLVWNWPPAKVFMGDVGSGFLGYSLGAFVLVSSRLDSALGMAVIILLGAFVADATVTLLRRAARGEMVHEAHCSHAYQEVARRLGRHLPVTTTLIAINILVLTPIAWLAVSGVIVPVVAVVVTYALLALGALAVGAGRAE